MKILALDTSGKSFSAALNIDGQTSAALYYNCGMIHSEKVLETIDNILKVCRLSLKDIDKFALTSGPGSFTGIRVGMTAIKTMSQILNKPAVVIDSLTVLEKSMPQIKGIKTIAAINALRGDVFIKRGGKIIISGINSFLKPLKKHKNKILIIGDAAIEYRDIIKEQLGGYAVSLPSIYHYPKASVLAKEALHLDGQGYEKISPLYIRKSWAEERK